MKIIQKKFMISLIVGLCSCLWMNGQGSYSIIGHTLSGELIGDNPAFHLNDKARFYVVDANNQLVSFTSCAWSIEGLDLNDEKRIIVEEVPGDYFHFSLDTTTLHKTNLKDLNQVNIDSDSIIYNQVKIICKGLTVNNIEIECEKAILLDILPVKPRIKPLRFALVANYDGDNNNKYAYADFNIILSCNDSGYIHLREYDEYGLHLSVLYPTWLSSNEVTISPEDQSVYFRYFFWYPFDYKNYGAIQVESINEFGYVLSDLFIVNDSINKYATKQEDIKSNRITIFPNPVKDHFIISGIMAEEIQNVVVVDLSGKILKTIHFDQEPIDISDLEKGLYSILISYRNRQKRDIVKIIKY